MIKLHDTQRELVRPAILALRAFAWGSETYAPFFFTKCVSIPFLVTFSALCETRLNDHGIRRVKDRWIASTTKKARYRREVL